jgi:hypothetical protein
MSSGNHLQRRSFLPIFIGDVQRHLPVPAAELMRPEQAAVGVKAGHVAASRL